MSVIICGAFTNAALSQDRPVSSLAAALPEDALVRVDVTGTSHAPSHPFFAAINAWVRQTAFLDAVWKQPGYLLADEGWSAFERQLGLTRSELISQLTADGFAAAVLPGQPPSSVLLFNTGDAGFPIRLLEAADALVGSASPRPDAPDQGREKGRAWRRLGPIMAVAAGPHLVIASSRELATAALDRLETANPDPNRPSPESLHARIEIDVPRLRAALDMPAHDAGGLAVLGGWIDLLRRFDRLTLDVDAPADRLTMRARASAPQGARVTPGLEGFFAQPGGPVPLPLLNPPGTLYAASWVRDYAALWEARDRLLEPEQAAKITQGDLDSGTQMQVFGAEFTPSQLISQIGPHFRVALLTGSPPYDEVLPPNILPAGVAVVDLKDEAKVRNWMGPVFRIINLILNGDQGIVSTTETFQDANLIMLSIPTSADAQRKGSLDRFNFRTTYAFAHGSFVIGSTPGAVKAAIDVLQAESSPSLAFAGTVTERQRLNLSRADEVLQVVDEALFRGCMLSVGLSATDSRAEIERLHALVRSLGSLESAAGFSDDGFEYRVEWTPVAPVSTAAVTAP